MNIAIGNWTVNEYVFTDYLSNYQLNNYFWTQYYINSNNNKYPYTNYNERNSFKFISKMVNKESGTDQTYGPVDYQMTGICYLL